MDELPATRLALSERGTGESLTSCAQSGTRNLAWRMEALKEENAAA
jgi:hypothetical protein